MGSNKWRLPESLLLLAFFFLGLFAVGLPFPIPAFLLPTRSYLALPSESGASALKEMARGSREAWALRKDSLLRLPRPGASNDEWKAAAASLPDRPVFDALEAELESGRFPALRRARLIADFMPTAGEIEGLDRSAKSRGIPLEIVTPPRSTRPGVLSYSWRTGTSGLAFPFEFLLSPEAVMAGVNIEVRGLYGAEGGESRVLWRGAGSEVPADRVLRLSAESRGLISLSVDLDAPGGKRSISLVVPAERSMAPKVLVVAEKYRGPSFIDSLYATKHVDPGDVHGLDPADWELVVIDGVPLSHLDGAFSRRLSDDAASGRTSVLFAADSAAFGRKGDNPPLEEILPVTLLPPSLKDIPDMSILILLDYSGSMFGGKLSLAKVASLELLRGLKPDDRVGLLLFSDKRKWVWSFVPNRSISAAPVLDPVEAEGGTELAPALIEGMDRLAATGPGEKHIVVISDGVTRPADFAALAAKAKEKGISISTMGVGADMDRPLLERLAAGTGGSFRVVNSADEIPSLIFEDRKNLARPRFSEGRIPILDPAGTKVATIGGMAQYALKAGSSVLFANELGDPLLAETESGNRAVMLFASDIHGGFTGDFFANPSVVSTMRARLDSLFSEPPRDIAVLETGSAATLSLASDALIAPLLELSQVGQTTEKFAFKRPEGQTWGLALSLPSLGTWRATLVDRGTGLASFDLPVDSGLDGVDTPSLRALADYHGLAFRLIEGGKVWLLLFFASALASTLAMRRAR
ncbi:MAG TPA: VWA domain-containing protein [Rectinemataceae bacterium]|nr:VWA domain-containing protein [Rectinemataceae bacterium]